MSLPGSRPVNPAGAAAQINLRGAIDLSSLKNPRPPAGAAAASSTSTAGGRGNGPEGTQFVVDGTDRNFPELVQLSADVPVVVAMWAAWSQPSQQLAGLLEKLVGEYAGKLLLAVVDTDAYPQIAQAFQADTVPTVVALVKGQPLPLFQGPVEEAQARSLFDELLKVAAANGVTGSVGGQGEEPEAAPLPPLHQAAFDAIEAGDYAAAEAAFKKALAERPADVEARAGLAQVRLMQRVEGIEAAEADRLRQRAADLPDDLEAQLPVADLDVVGGHVEDGFSRIVGFIGRNFGPERETARVRLLELFDVVGSSDPRVAKARQALARVLF